MADERRVRVFAAATGLSLLALILAGTLVHTHQAALSVPDWPLSYGKLILGRWPGNVFYEQIHRALAAVSALLLTGLLLVFRRREPARAVGALFALYLVQVGIGGVIVLRLNPPLVTALHVVVAQLIACGVWLVAAGAFRDAASPRAGAPDGRRSRLAVATTWTLVLQIVLGTLARHPPGKTVFVAALLGHLAVALALVFLVPVTSVRLARRTRSAPAARRTSVALGLLFLLQLAVAVPLFIVAPEPLTEGPTPRFFPALHGAHVLLATLLLTASAYLATRRLPPSPDAAAGIAGTRT
jgi:heme A synthase